jgi:hypothetical protein
MLLRVRVHVVFSNFLAVAKVEVVELDQRVAVVGRRVGH